MDFGARIRLQSAKIFGKSTSGQGEASPGREKWKLRKQILRNEQHRGTMGLRDSAEVDNEIDHFRFHVYRCQKIGDVGLECCRRQVISIHTKTYPKLARFRGFHGGSNEPLRRSG